MEEKYPIKPEWTKYYHSLEAIRKSGVCNMWGGDEYLKLLYPELRRKEASEILVNWITNYNALNEAFGWN